MVTKKQIEKLQEKIASKQQGPKYNMSELNDVELNRLIELLDKAATKYNNHGEVEAYNLKKLTSKEVKELNEINNKIEVGSNGNKKPN